MKGACTATRPAVMRLTGTGALDAAFGSDGLFASDFRQVSRLPRSCEVRALAAAADGRILAAGNGRDLLGFGGGYVARHLPDGRLDPSFGQNGVAEMSPRTCLEGADDPSWFPPQVWSIAVDSGGRVLAAGAFLQRAALVRLRADGETDVSFADRGWLDAPDLRLLVDVAVQPDGKILAGGSGYARCVVLRANPDGTLDPAFGTGGVASVAPGACDRVAAIGLLPDGRILVAGTYDSVESFCLAGLLPDGRADASFGDGGRTLTAFPGRMAVSAVGLAIGPGARVVVAGSANGYDILARFFSNGRLDTSFGNAGRVVTRHPDPTYGSANSTLTGVVVQPDAKVLTVSSLSRASSRMALVRYTSQGGLDPAFGTGGFLRPSPLTNGHAILIPRPGTVLVGGWTGNFVDDLEARLHTVLRLSAVTPVELTRFVAD